MREYVDSCARHENAARTRNLLGRIVTDGRLHARFVNTLSRLEYVASSKSSFALRQGKYSTALPIRWPLDAEGRVSRGRPRTPRRRR